MTTLSSELQIFDARGKNSRSIYNGGKDGQLTFPAWSPDGKAIAFGFGSYFTGHARPAAIDIVNADGAGLRALTEGPGNAGFPSWSPDGKQILYRVAGEEQGLS